MNAVTKLFMRELEIMDEGKNPEEYLKDRFGHILSVMSYRVFIGHIRLAIQEFYANYY